MTSKHENGECLTCAPSGGDRPSDATPVYLEGGWLQEGLNALCPECKRAKEGTVSWGLWHESKCAWRPAGWADDRKQRVSAEDPTAYYCAACKDTGCSECNGHTYAQRGQCPAVDQGSRCVYGRGHRINRHCDGERSWPKEQGSEPTTRGWTSLSDERIDVLATRAGGHCVGAPATRDEERAMALEIRKARAQRRERATNLHGCTAPVRCGECDACRKAEGR